MKWKPGSGAIRPATSFPRTTYPTVTVSHNGKQVLSAEWGPAVAKNPYLQFKFKGGKKGDKLTVTWVDNKGDTRTDEATITLVANADQRAASGIDNVKEEDAER